MSSHLVSSSRKRNEERTQIFHGNVYKLPIYPRHSGLSRLTNYIAKTVIKSNINRPNFIVIRHRGGGRQTRTGSYWAEPTTSPAQISYRFADDDKTGTKARTSTVDHQTFPAQVNHVPWSYRSSFMSLNYSRGSLAKCNCQNTALRTEQKGGTTHRSERTPPPFQHAPAI